MACGPFFLMPGAVRVHPHRGRVQRDGLDLDAHDLLQLQLLEDPVHHAAFRPAVHPRVNGMPVAEPLRQTAPLAAMLSYVEQGIQQLKFDRLTLPRCTGRLSLIRAYCSSVISID
jgi:hypothetical protein